MRFVFLDDGDDDDEDPLELFRAELREEDERAQDEEDAYTVSTLSVGLLAGGGVTNPPAFFGASCIPATMRKPDAGILRDFLVSNCFA